MDTLRIYVVTWNVATQSPGQDLNSLLDFPSQFNKSKLLPDFYIIGLQEVKSQPQNLLMDTLFTDAWSSSFNKILCRQGYIMAKTIRLQGILLTVYAQMKHITHLRDIEAQYTKTGLGGLWGNKGAVSVRFNIYGCSICLVNCHLTAHEHLLADRINDYNTIINQHVYHVNETINILYHDYVFWIGDLNFRTDHPSGSAPTVAEIIAALQKVEKDKYAKILEHDQLVAVMKSGEAFSAFKEPEIRFPPTYKFNIGTDEYDIKRKPSWTDRILYKVVPNNYENVTLRADALSYNHMPHYTVSDHKPVIGLFTIKTRLGSEALSPRAIPKPLNAGIQMRSAMVFSYVQEETVTDSPISYEEAEEATPELHVSTMPPYCEHTALKMCVPPITFAYNVRGLFTLVERQFQWSWSKALRALVERSHGLCLPFWKIDSFANYTEQLVEFAPVSGIWYIGDADFRTQCTLSPDVNVNPNDWIGIFDANFQSLDDYIAYEYLAKVSLPHSPVESQIRVITLSFPVGSGVRTPGFYRFIYFSQPNNDVRSVLGISEPFEVSSKDEKVVAAELREFEQASGSSSTRRRQPTTTADVFTDFTGLDVASLSRHFSNDLNID